MPDEPGSGAAPNKDKSLALVQREVALVVVLCVVAVVTFLATRRLADWHHDTASAAAQAWFDKGQALIGAGDVDEGIAALRKAVGADRGNLEYTLGLVRALRGANQDEEAWQILLRLREEEPEHSEINYRLARLASRRGETDLAVRYYNHALYGVEAEDAAIERRDVLTELAELQLDLGDVDAATAVLSQLAREPAAGPEMRVVLARLYARAGQQQEALATYQTVLGETPGHVEARLGAANAALAIGDLRTARGHLEAAEAAGADVPDLGRQIDVVRRAIEQDPLAPRLAMAERVRRLTGGLGWAAARLDACPREAGAEAPIGAELAAFRGQPRADLRDTDVLAAGVDLVARVEADVRARCAQPDPAGDAWSLIRRVHGAAR